MANLLSNPRPIMTLAADLAALAFRLSVVGGAQRDVVVAGVVNVDLAVVGLAPAVQRVVALVHGRLAHHKEVGVLAGRLCGHT